MPPMLQHPIFTLLLVRYDCGGMHRFVFGKIEMLGRQHGL
jgi:hypothetical protein